MKILNSLLVKSFSTNTGGSKEVDTFYDFQSKGKRLERIHIRHGEIIDGMRFMYSGTWTEWCGNNYGGEEVTFELENGEYIDEVSGTYGRWFQATHILTLTIHTNRNQKFSFGSGNHGENSTSFSFGISGYDIIGFGLKSNTHWFNGTTDYVSEIGVYCVPKEMEFIGSLFFLYKKGLEHFHNIVLGTYSDGRMNVLLDQIRSACPPSSQIIEKSIEWYENNQQGNEEDDYLRTLAMLTFYNDYYSNKTIAESITSYGLMATGRRMWQYKDLIAGDYLFPNLRFMPLLDNEFDSYNSSLQTVIQSPIYSMVNNKKTSFRVGSSSLNDIIPVFKGTKKLQNSNYGIQSTRISDYPYTGAISTEKAKDEIGKALLWAIENKIEIWLLPEMCMDEEMLSYLKLLLLKKKGQLGNIKLIIAGSTYQKTNPKGRYSNRAPIWILDKDQCLIELAGYDKKIPFSMNVPQATSSPDIQEIKEHAIENQCNILVESLELGDKGTSFRIVRIESGYIGIAICRDVLDLSERCNPLNRYVDFVDIMLVISMNSGHTNCFVSTSESMARWHYCATVYNNNMTSVLNPNDKTVEMAFAIWPKYESAAGIQGTIYYRSAPIFRQLLQAKDRHFDKDEFIRSSESVLTSIYSGSVVAKDMPQDGNVFYDITTVLNA